MKRFCRWSRKMYENNAFNCISVLVSNLFNLHNKLLARIYWELLIEEKNIHINDTVSFYWICCKRPCYPIMKLSSLIKISINIIVFFMNQASIFKTVFLIFTIVSEANLKILMPFAVHVSYNKVPLQGFKDRFWDALILL